jgi:hypothetical protein
LVVLGTRGPKSERERLLAGLKTRGVAVQVVERLEIATNSFSATIDCKNAFT